QGGLNSFFAGLMRLRAVQITAVAALLLTLVQVGKMITGEGGSLWTSNRMMAFAPSAPHEELGRTVVSGSNIPTAQEAAPSSSLSLRREPSRKANELRLDTGATSTDARDE